MENITTEKEYEVQYYEIDFKEKLLITSLMNYFGDISTKQSEDIGVGLKYLKDQGNAWVLYKWNIHIDRYPLYREKIIVRTKPYSFRKFYAYRIFEVIDSNGNIIANASSVWFLIDTIKRKAIRITDEMYKMFGLSKDKSDVLYIKKIISPKNIDSEKVFSVRYSDIDTNKHVNNVKYVDWAIETIPLDIVINYTLTDLNITYEKETTYGETVKVFTGLKKGEKAYTCLHRITDSGDKELALIETIWENKD